MQHINFASHRGPNVLNCLLTPIDTPAAAQSVTSQGGNKAVLHFR